MAVNPTPDPTIGQMASPLPPPDTAPTPAVSVEVAPVSIAQDVVGVLPDVLNAIKDPGSLKSSAMAILTAIVAVGVALGAIKSGTDAVILSVAGVVLPSVFMVAHAIHGHATATVQAAAIRAKAQ